MVAGVSTWVGEGIGRPQQLITCRRAKILCCASRSGRERLGSVNSNYNRRSYRLFFCSFLVDLSRVTNIDNEGTARTQKNEWFFVLANRMENNYGKVLVGKRGRWLFVAPALAVVTAGLTTRSVRSVGQQK